MERKVEQAVVAEMNVKDLEHTYCYNHHSCFQIILDDFHFDCGYDMFQQHNNQHLSPQELQAIEQKAELSVETKMLESKVEKWWNVNRKWN